MFKSLHPQNDPHGDKKALYPRQTLPEGFVRAPENRKIPTGLFDVLKADSESLVPKSRAGAAFAAFTSIQKAATTTNGNPDRRPTATTTDFLGHWKRYALAKRAEQDSLTRQMDAVFKQVNLSGFKQISRAPTWRIKCLWFVIVFLLSGVMVYECIQCFRAYKKSPITTTYRLLTPDAMDFPQIYLCYGSSFNRSYITMHRDQMAIATAYRSRSAVTKGGNNRRKRDLGQTFNHDPNDIRALGDDEISRILLQSNDPPTTEEGISSGHETEKWWKNGNRLPDDEDDTDWVPEYEFTEDDSYQEPDLERGKRAAVEGSGNFTNGINGTFNATKAAEEKAKAAAAEQAKRIEAMMNAPNISEVVYDYIREASYRIEETFLECEFHSYKPQKLNCKEVLIPIMDANYGMCFLVNLPDTIKQTKAGHGLRLLLHSHINLYPRANEGAPKYAGLFVSVNKQYDPFNWLKSLAAPGHLTKIDLDGSYVELLNLKSGPLIQPCVDEEGGQKRLQIFKGTYSRTVCQMDCLYQAHRNACNCILPIDKSQVKDEVMNDTMFCGPKQFKGCLASSAEATDRAVNACRELCHTPCKSYRYEMRSSYAKLHGPGLAHLKLPPNVTASQLIELRVAFNRKEIVQLIQAPSASAADLVSNLGGQINLWMGASMITILQIILMGIGFVIWRVSFKTHRALKRRGRRPSKI